MSGACARWIALSDREALGEALGTAESSFITKHAAACSACGAEAATWQALSSVVPGQEPSAATSAGGAWAARARRGAAWAAAVACAAAIALALAAYRAPAPRVSTAPPRPERLEEAHEAGALVRAGQGVTCFGFDHGVRACLAPHSSLRVITTDRARELRLHSGKIAVELDPQPAGSSFAISTRAGTAVAVGTAFSVEVPEDGGPVLTRVLHGIVLVRPVDGAESLVAAHHMASMPGAVQELAPVDEARELTLLHGKDQPDQAGAARTDLAVQRAAPTSRPQPRAAAEALLLQAREHAANGDVRAALAAYHELFEHHAASSEAQAARVAYGEMLLGLDDAEAALPAFERYLEAGGALEQEASFGRIRALRALARTGEERTAITQFLRRFSTGPLADLLRARERQLGAR